jgi:HlyD family secretion protein
LSRQRWILTAVVMAAVLAFVWWWKLRSAEEAPKYRVAAVERGPIESLVSATGTVRPVIQVEVGSQVSGTVQRLFADYNSTVRRGQVLCQLEPSSFRARAALAAAAVARAVAALKDARRQFARAQELIVKNYVSRADVDAAEVAVEQREAELKQARAQLQASNVDLDNTTINAPIDGVVIARSVDVGQTVAASLQAPRLFVIANDLVHMQVETRIDEADIGVIRPGLPARFTVDAFPDLTFRGSVAQVRLEPIVEQGVVTYTTVIHTDNPDLKLRPGMTANVSVLVAQRDDALKVQNAALRFRPPPAGRRGGEARAATRASGGGRVAQARGPAATGSPGAGGGSRAGAGADVAERRGPSRRGDDGSARGMPGPPSSDAGAGRALARGGADGEPAARPGTVYVLRNGKPVAVEVLTGLTDGAFTEVRSDGLKPGDQVVVGLEVSSRDAGLRPPPGLGRGAH